MFLLPVKWRKNKENIQTEIERDNADLTAAQVHKNGLNKSE